MQIEQMRVTCGKCGEVSDIEIVINAPLEVSLASMKAARCPNCGAKKLFMGGEHKDKPTAMLSLEDRYQWWKSRGDVGTSGETIASAFMGGRPRDVDVPHDPDDFSRCWRLLDLIPEWRSRLPEVIVKYPWFAPFIEAWDELEKMYLKHVETGKPDGMYERMQELLEQSRTIQTGTQ